MNKFLIFLKKYWWILLILIAITIFVMWYIKRRRLKKIAEKFKNDIKLHSSPPNPEDIQYSNDDVTSSDLRFYSQEDMVINAKYENGKYWIYGLGRQFETDEIGYNLFKSEYPNGITDMMSILEFLNLSTLPAIPEYAPLVLPDSSRQ